MINTSMSFIFTIVEGRMFLLTVGLGSKPISYKKRCYNFRVKQCFISMRDIIINTL